MANDPDLNWNDTWISETQTFAETTVVTSSEPFLDENGNSVTSITVGVDPEVVSVLAGYGYDGQLRVTSGFTPTSFQETSLVRLVGNTPYDKTMYEPLTANVIESEPLSTLGDVAYAQIDPGGGGGGDCSSNPEVCQYETGPNRGSGAPSASRRRFHRIDADHLQAIIESNQMATSASSPNASPKETRDYEKRGNDWVLTHVKRELERSSPAATMRLISHQRMSNITYRRNARLDAERKKTARTQALPEQQKGDSGDIPTIAECPTEGTTMLGCEGGGGGSGGGAGGGGAVAYDQSTIPPDEFVFDSASIGQALVFQHGLASSGKTWERMGNWMKIDHPSSPKYLPSLSWRAPYAVQADELRQRLVDKYANRPAIIIGHSNGGMVGRNLARDPGPTLVLGVVTVGTPHWGAPVAGNAAAVAKLLGFDAAGVMLGCYVIEGAGCRLTSTAALETAFYYLQYGSGVPVLNEMKYYDSWHYDFNASTENVQRYGVISEVWKKWVIWRMAGDRKCFGDDPICGGGVRVQKVDKAFHHDVSCAIVGGVLGIVLPAVREAAASCAADAAFLRAWDNLFIKLAVRGLGSDGAVPVVSQRFPLIPENNIRRMLDGPSHLGETSHFRTRNVLTEVIDLIKKGT